MLKVLFEDNHLICVYKPKGVASQGGNDKFFNVFDLTKQYIKEKYNKKGNVYLALLHRLDLNTEGLILLAKTEKAARRMSEDFRFHNVEKKYVALVEGYVDCGVLKNNLIKDESLKKAIISDSGKEAILEYNKIFYDNKRDITVVNINLKTGRFHQIRAQFSYISHPLYGDKKYGSKRLYDGIFLKNYFLSFIHPVKKETIIINIDKNIIY